MSMKNSRVPSNQAFLEELQSQAKLQSTLHHHSLIPKQLDFFTSLIGNYPWQFLLVSSGITAVLMAVLKQ